MNPLAHLQHCSSLRTFHMRLFASFDTFPVDTAIQWRYLISLLSTHSGGLNQVIVGIRMDLTIEGDPIPADDFTTIRWRELDTILCSALWRSAQHR